MGYGGAWRHGGNGNGDCLRWSMSPLGNTRWRCFIGAERGFVVPRRVVLKIVGFSVRGGNGKGDRDLAADGRVGTSFGISLMD
jgi:hypothetical protein